jgi:hypothetical protein
MTTKYNYEEMCDYLFKWHAPNFNFQHGGEELLEIALDRGFIKRKFDEGVTKRSEVYYVLSEED